MFLSRVVSRQLVRPPFRQATKLFLSTNASPNVNLVINAVGLDRLGIVSDVTGVVIEAGGNVGDSQAAKLHSHFSLMMEVTLPRDKLDALKTQLAAMPDMNASVYEDPSSDSGSTGGASTAATPQIGYTGKFILEGADNPGIVHKMTSAIAKHGLSIDRMHTDQALAPQGGTVLFHINATVTASAPLAAGFDAEKIREDLEAIGDSLNCDVTLEDA